MHVSWYEADAFARWRGARLPTEAEWERAACLDRRRGRATSTSSPSAPARPARFVGDCWEWTASDFGGYPGFRAFPYREYSEVFFGPRYKVLRGGSWATRPRVARDTFRNWDLPRAAPDLRRLPLRTRTGVSDAREPESIDCTSTAACPTRSPTTCATA